VQKGNVHCHAWLNREDVLKPAVFSRCFHCWHLVPSNVLATVGTFC